MPFDRSRYPDDWEAIRDRIRKRAGGKCEWCGAVNYQPHPITGSKIVLTIAHLGTPHTDGRDRAGDAGKMTSPAASCQRGHTFGRDRDRARGRDTARSRPRG